MLESLDPRDLMSVYAWTGAVSTDAADIQNWATDAPPAPPMPGMPGGMMVPPLPGPYDDIYFNAAANDSFGNSRNCERLAYANTSFAGMHIQSGYNGTVYLDGAISVGTFDLAAGAISQAGIIATLTVTDSFTWTGGILNSSAYLSTVQISGATALFAPANGGTVNLGSSISLENGAAGTLKEGTIDLNKDGIQFRTSTGSSLRLASDTAAGVLYLGWTRFLEGQIGPGTNWTVDNDTLVRIHGELVNNAGTYSLLSGAAVEISGVPSSDIAYTQVGATAATYLHGDSELTTGFAAPGAHDRSIQINSGILATVYDSDAGTGNATITTKTLEILGGDIYVNYGPGAHTHFGQLAVDGDIFWNGGTFHAYVYTDGSTCDVLRTINGGAFDVDSGTVAPIFVDSDYGESSFPHSGDSWQVLLADGLFLDADAPTVTNTSVWKMQKGPGNPFTYWALVAK